MTDLHADELLENIRPIKAVLACVGTALVVLGLAYGGGYWRGATVTAQRASKAEAHALQQADQAKGEADALKVQAAKKDAEIAAKDRGLAEARANVARTTAELAAYRAAHPATPAVDPLPDEPVSPGVADLAPLVRKQDAVIQAQTGLIRELETRVFDITASRDLWKASAEAREREAAGLRIALEAQKSLAKGALWKGRVSGFLVGVGAGYLGGRSR